MLQTVSVSLKTLKQDFSDVNLVESEQFYWSARNKTVYFNFESLNQKEGFDQLFHELGHAKCGHKTFNSGVGLLKMELEAWMAAKVIAKQYNHIINQDHIEACLDSYRDWLYKRSKCPTCENISVEIDTCKYHCFNCQKEWSVSADQRQRCYRRNSS